MRTREIEPSPLVLITSPDPHKLRALLARETARRAMIVHTPVRRVAVGLWAAEVVQLRPLERRWVRPAAVAAGCTAVLGGSAAAGWWLLGVLADVVAQGIAFFGVAAFGVLVVLVLVAFGSRRSSGCETIVTVHHRHR